MSSRVKRALEYLIALSEMSGSGGWHDILARGCDISII